MAKSSKKQCRAPKPPRQGGGLVVVSQRNLQSKPASQGPRQGKKGKPTKGQKKKKGLGLGDLIAGGDGDESDDFDAPPHPRPAPVVGASGIAEFVFSSTHNSREQRLYYLLATRPATPSSTATLSSGARAAPPAAAAEGGCHALVFVETTAAAQGLIGELKALGLAAFAIHERKPKAQAQEHIKRFLASASTEKSSILMLTNSAVARSPPAIGPIKFAQAALLRVVHFDQPEGEKNAAARGRVAAGFFRGRVAGTAEEVHLEGVGDAAGSAPFSFDSAAMGGIRSRLAVAKKLSRAVALSAGEGEERGMQKAAAAAGLEWDGDAGQSNKNGAEGAKTEKRRAHAQQAAALRQKMAVLLCQPLLPPPAPVTSASTPGTSTSTPLASKSAPQSAKELRKKMTVLGMISGPQQTPGAGAGMGDPSTGAAGGKGAKARGAEDRTTAQTRWLDDTPGDLFGGSWGGRVRTGASCDSASLEVRSRVEAAKQAGSAAAAAAGSGSGHGGVASRKGGSTGVLSPATVEAYAKWNPNPDTPDPDKWGGRWGKPCGHNEVVLQHVRPFAPMEVVNTRVCSKASPAPGNAGFDGCLELLSLTCRAHARALTVWDDECFVHIDRTGATSSMPKQRLLHLPLPTLRFLMKNMRSFTVCGGGQRPPREVARAVVRAAGWGAKQSRFGSLSAELSKRVMSFVLSGDQATWRTAAAGFGMGAVRQAPGAGSGAALSGGKAPPRDTLAFASKKKRKNFNL
ncbi:unnamed protein product [Scytosiphon promiscuus]